MLARSYSFTTSRSLLPAPAKTSNPHFQNPQRSGTARGPPNALTLGGFHRICACTKHACSVCGQANPYVLPPPRRYPSFRAAKLLVAYENYPCDPLCAGSCLRFFMSYMLECSSTGGSCHTHGMQMMASPDGHPQQRGPSAAHVPADRVRHSS